jgi:inosose dehydratase
MESRMAAAPASWGRQLERERLLAEARGLGFKAIEAGPEGWLPEDGGQAVALLTRFGLALASGETEAVLHHPESRRQELARVERRARWVAAAGGRVLTVVASAAAPGERLTSLCWLRLLDAIGSVMEICARRKLQVAVRPRFGSAIERPQDVERLLVTSEVPLCLDTAQLMLGGCDPADLVLMAPTRIKHVHLSDAGEGTATLWDVVEALRATRYEGWYVIDHSLATTNLFATA